MDTAMAIREIAQGCQDHGIPVDFMPGWERRGYKGRSMKRIKGLMLHHTGITNYPTVLRDGHSTLPGPLSHFGVSRQGVLLVVAAGLCNHAGKGLWQMITGGNSHFLGVEAHHDGGRDWPRSQYTTLVILGRCVRKTLGGHMALTGHKEWARPKGRKVDPSFGMDDYRRHVADTAMTTKTTKEISMTTSTKFDPYNRWVEDWQQDLSNDGWSIKVDGLFGEQTLGTSRAVRDLAAHSRVMEENLRIARGRIAELEAQLGSAQRAAQQRPPVEHRATDDTDLTLGRAFRELIDYTRGAK